MEKNIGRKFIIIISAVALLVIIVSASLVYQYSKQPDNNKANANIKAVSDIVDASADAVNAGSIQSHRFPVKSVSRDIVIPVDKNKVILVGVKGDHQHIGAKALELFNSGKEVDIYLVDKGVKVPKW